MWLFPEEIEAELASKDPGRISAALRALNQYLDDMNVFPLPPPRPEAALFGGRLPEAVALDLLRIWESWPELSPALPDSERYVWLLDLLRDSQSPTVTYRAALDCRVTKDRAALTPMLAALAARPREEWPTLAAFVDHLLAGGPELRSAIVSGLAAHRSAAVDALAADMTVDFTAEERARITGAPARP